MHKQYVVMFLLLAFRLVTAQKINLYVMDSQSNPIGKVLCKTSDSLYISNALGLIELNPTTSKISCTLTAWGYQTVLLDTILSNSFKINLILTSNAQQLNDVIIAATHLPQGSAMALSTVTKNELQLKNSGIDIPLLLHNVPGVISTSDAGNGIGYTGFRIRGTDPTRINITVNGVPLNDAESQLTYFVNMPDFVSSVKQIQIQRGAGGSTNGAGSFGASVHFQTQDIEPLPYARLQSGIGSYNTFRNTFSAGTGLLKSKFAFDLRLSSIQSKGYIDRAFSKLYAGFFQLAYITTNNLFKCIYFPGFEKTYQAWYYVPDSLLKTHRTFNPAGMYTVNGQLKYYDNETDNYQQHNVQWHWVHQFKSHWNLKYTLYYTKGKGYYEQFKAQESLSAYFEKPLLLQGDTINASNLVRQLWLDNNAIGQIFNVNYKHTFLDIQLGIAHHYYKGQHFGIVQRLDALPNFNPFKYYNNNAQKHDANAFIRIQYTALKRTSLFVDVQNRLVNYAYAGITAPLNPPQLLDTLFLFFNPKAGIAYTLMPEITVNMSYARAQKEPNRDDFTNSTPLSRPKPEILDDYEIGVYWRKPSIEVQLQGYYMNYKNQLVLDGSINNVGAYNRVNVPNSFRRGLEFLIRYQHSNLSCSFNACASQNIILEYSQYADIYDLNYNWMFQRKTTYNTSAIAFSPNFTSSFELNYKLNAFMGLQSYWRYVGAQFLDNSQSELKKINPYQVLDLGLQLNSFRRIKSLSMQLMVYNVLNALYETTGYTYGYGIQNSTGQIENYNFNHYATAAPLNLMLSLKWNW